MKDTIRGRKIDSRVCAKCHKKLGNGDAVAAKCCHVFHSDCSLDGWCPICNRRFEIVSKDQFVSQSQILKQFDHKEINVEKSNVKKRSNGSDKLLQQPTIGEVVVPLNNMKNF